MTRTDTMRAALVRSLTGVLTVLAVTAGTARAGDTPGSGLPAAWRVEFDAEARAEDDPPAPAPTFWQSVEFTGFVDGYYEWAFNESSLQLRNFDVNHNSFSLNYAEVALSKAVSETSRGGFRVDFGAGDTANMVNAFEPGGTDYLKYVQQAYVSYLVPVGKGLTVDFGKFVTPAGAEVIENKDNYNYSRGLLFALAIPYYHTGARIGYTVNDKVSLTGFLVNGWNNVKDNNSDKTVGVSLAIKPTAKIGVIGNYFVGKEQNADAEGGTRNLFDVVVSLAATDKVSVLAQLRLRPRQAGGRRRGLVRAGAGREVPGHRQVGVLAALRDLHRRRRVRDRHRADAAGHHAHGRVQGGRRAHRAVRVPHRLLRRGLLRQGQRPRRLDAAEHLGRADLRVQLEAVAGSRCRAGGQRRRAVLQGGCRRNRPAPGRASRSATARQRRSADLAPPHAGRRRQRLRRSPPASRQDPSRRQARVQEAFAVAADWSMARRTAS